MSNTTSTVTAVPATSPVPSRIALVSFGNIGKGLLSESAACYDLLFSVERLFGWKVFPMYGSYELALIAPQFLAMRGQYIPLVNQILDRFTVIVQAVGSSHEKTHAPVPPDQADMVFLNVNVASYSRLFGRSLSRFAPSLLLTQKGTRLCDTRLGRILKEFKVARVVLASSSHAASTCGSRLVNFNPQDTAEGVQIWPLTVWPIAVRPGKSVFAPFPHIIVIPDIHGDIDGFVTSLWLGYSAVASVFISLPEFNTTIRAAKPLDTRGQKVFLVQLGDLIDRGPYTKECIELALSLPTVFPDWQTALLMGNHELMNFHRSADYYVHANDALQGEARSAAFEGSLWHRLASKLLLAVIVGRILLVHASLDPAWLLSHAALIQHLFPSPDIISSLNQLGAYSFLQAPDVSHVFGEEESPVWSRALEALDEEELCQTYFPKMAAAFEIDMVIVGHNPQRSKKIRTRCQGKVVLADVRISKWMSTNGNPMALHVTREKTLNPIYFRNTCANFLRLWPLQYCNRV